MTTVTSVNPNRGLVAGGTPVTITGTGFSTASTPIVMFGTNPATNVNVISSTTITANTPPSIAGSVTVGSPIYSFLATGSNPSLFIKEFVGSYYWGTISDTGTFINNSINFPSNSYIIPGPYAQVAGTATLYIPTSGNYNFNFYHWEGGIFAINGASIISGPPNSNPGNQTQTPICGYAFSPSLGWNNNLAGVAAANNSGGNQTDSYVINFPFAGYYSLEFGIGFHSALIQSGEITFYTGTNSDIYVPPYTNQTIVSGTVYLYGNCTGFVMNLSGNSTYAPLYSSYGSGGLVNGFTYGTSLGHVSGSYFVIGF